MCEQTVVNSAVRISPKTISKFNPCADHLQTPKASRSQYAVGPSFWCSSPMIAPQWTSIISLSRRTIAVSASPHGCILSFAAGAHIRQAVKLGSLLAPWTFSMKMTVSDAGIAGAAAGIQDPDFGAHLVRLRVGTNALRCAF